MRQSAAAETCDSDRERNCGEAVTDVASARQSLTCSSASAALCSVQLSCTSARTVTSPQRMRSFIQEDGARHWRQFVDNAETVREAVLEVVLEISELSSDLRLLQGRGAGGGGGR